MKRAFAAYAFIFLASPALAVNTCGTGTILVGKIGALNHDLTDPFKADPNRETWQGPIISDGFTSSMNCYPGQFPRFDAIINGRISGYQCIFNDRTSMGPHVKGQLACSDGRNFSYEGDIVQGQ